MMNPNIARQRRAKAAQAHQGGNSGHTQRRDNSEQPQINVGEVERQLSMIGGTALAVCGLTRGTFTGLALAAIGGALIWRGYSGHCQMYEMLGHSSAEHQSGQSAGNQASQSQQSRIQHEESHAF
jgi:hypothetical protein